MINWACALKLCFTKSTLKSRQKKKNVIRNITGQNVKKLEQEYYHVILAHIIWLIVHQIIKKLYCDTVIVWPDHPYVIL